MVLQASHEHSIRNLKETRGMRSIEDLDKENSSLRATLEKQGRTLRDTAARVTQLTAITVDQAALIKLLVRFGCDRFDTIGLVPLAGGSGDGAVRSPRRRWRAREQGGDSFFHLLG
jgi:hypothetical protein